MNLDPVRGFRNCHPIYRKVGLYGKLVSLNSITNTENISYLFKINYRTHPVSYVQFPLRLFKTNVYVN